MAKFLPKASDFVLWIGSNIEEGDGGLVEAVAQELLIEAMATRLEASLLFVTLR